MALLDEQLVEEWLNYQGFFTMRGVRCGGGEIDLLAVRTASSGVECWHVECQISFNPIGYIGGPTTARARTREQVAAGSAEWVERKFTAEAKARRRSQIIAGVDWRYRLIHAVVRDPYNLRCIEALGVETIPYSKVLADLQAADRRRLGSSIASDIVGILNYVRQQ